MNDALLQRLNEVHAYIAAPMVAKRRRSAAPSSLRSLQRHARCRVGINLTGSPTRTRPLLNGMISPMFGQSRGVDFLDDRAEPTPALPIRSIMCSTSLSERAS